MSAGLWHRAADAGEAAGCCAVPCVCAASSGASCNVSGSQGSQGVAAAQTSDIETESRSASAALGLALAENFRSSSLGAAEGSYNPALGSDGVRSLSLSSTGTAQYLGLVRPKTPECTDRRGLAGLPTCPGLLLAALRAAFCEALTAPCASGVQGAMDSLQPNTPIAMQSNLSFTGAAVRSSWACVLSLVMCW